jgi:ethanolamine utilization protein EutN
MQSAKVVGTTTATVKHSSMNGWKLLIVQPYTTDGIKPDGDPQLAIDTLGAGMGEQVIITSDGPATREILGRDDSPVRYSVIGIADP